jgi:cytochrome c biogenesis protein CcmG/thiol:disulfide interchange protein DsbE
MKRFVFPIIGFALLLALFAFAIQKMQSGEYSPRHIPSPLVSKPLPAFQLPTLHDPKKKLGNTDFHGKVVLINVWASWCAACKQEHPVLMTLPRDRQAMLVGLNHKDKRGDALDMLKADGNPYDVSLVDADGRTGIDWGVYGVPETFVIDKQGVIRHKQIGPITPQIWSETLAPLIRKLAAE